MRWGTLVWAVGLGLAAACGDDNDGGGGVRTGLPVDQKLSTLDDEGAQAACHTMFDAMATAMPASDVLRAQCTAASIVANATLTDGELTVNIATCKSQADACVQDPTKYGVDEEEAAGDRTACDSLKAETTLKSCEASVGEYEACLTQLVGALRQRIAMFTCDNAKSLAQSEMEGSVDLDNIPECQTFTSKCPDVDLVPR